MIKPIDENFAKKMVVDYEVYTVKDYNDYVFDLPNNNTIPTLISLMAYNNPEKFKSMRNFLQDYSLNGHSDQFLLTMAYCRYAEKKFEEGINYISKYLENNPSNIDGWIDLCFFLSHISEGYKAHLNLRFHMYYFIHLYHALDFHTVNKDSIAVLNKLVRDVSLQPSVRSGYIRKVEFETEYLFINGKCNNNCEVCPVPVDLQEYDFEDRIIKNGYISLSKYIFLKIRKKILKKFVIKGGEPTLHPDYLKIIKVISGVRPDIIIQVRTNARTFCDPTFLDKHLETGAKNVVFEAGIFSSDAEIHDTITRVQNSHEQTLHGVDNILNAGMKVAFNIVLCDRNLESLPLTIDFLMNKYRGNTGFTGINVLLPPPSAESLVRYYQDGGLGKLHEKAAAIVCEYQNTEIPVTIGNEVLANCELKSCR